MAQAIETFISHAKFWVGPVVSEGFLLWCDLGEDVIKDDDILRLKKKWKICKDGKQNHTSEISEEAVEMFKDDEYKLDLISNFEDGTIISCYRQGDLWNLCWWS